MAAPQCGGSRIFVPQHPCSTPYFLRFVSHCISYTYKSEKYKAHILKYKALILK